MTPYLIEGDALEMVLDGLGVPGSDRVYRAYALRVAIDDDGVKLKIDNGSWSPPLGKVDA